MTFRETVREEIKYFTKEELLSEEEFQIEQLEYWEEKLKICTNEIKLNNAYTGIRRANIFLSEIRKLLKTQEGINQKNRKE